MAIPRICTIEGCDKPHYGRGWCSPHYKRWWTHGDPIAGRTPAGEPLRYFREVVLPYSGDECLIWPYARNPQGYGLLVINGRLTLVPRLACKHARGPAPTSKHEAAHSCGRGRQGCVTTQHLRWATHAENMADMAVHGTSPRGERSHFAKLTEDDVRLIRALKGTMLQREIAAQFGVARSIISRIHGGSIWAWLD